ncbi:UvrD-helicase domain-containing protein [uncultured Bacteroides sp.]|uniref:ATP-dependent helicase n=2 Tax=Bacteroides TaxID=816 RepID=UPI0026104C73|nr:UvrD-helicase domain-containing protein [uncultured Bacteroides sp.]
MSDYIQELNEEQRNAVLYNDGPSLVIAGAGSGKTRVLTYKIAYLIKEKNYDAHNILALTFTNKAAKEIVRRVNKDIGRPWSDYIWMGTFHSVFSRILRREAQFLGFTSSYTIYDAADSRSLLRTLIKEMKLDEKVYKPNVVQVHISNAKNHLVSPEGYANSKEAYEADSAIKMPLIRDIYKRYKDRCCQSDVMDFDDLLFYTFMLFRDHPEVLIRYQDLFRYVLVDEYQDTNYAQHCILLQLMQGKTPQLICAVGDDAQSIYSFRGADVDNILNFTKVYPNTKVFKLEQNYRSTQTIVCAANSLIEKNQRQIRKEVFSEKERGEAIGVYQAYSDVEEADIVVNKIMELRRGQHYAYSDFAILYRTNAQSRIFEEAMRKRGMPYRIYGGLSFYQRKEIKDVIAYFRLVVNPNDEEAFKRIINYPARGIGDTTVGKIIAAATEHNVSLWTVLCEPLTYGLNFNKGIVGKLQAFRDLIAGFIADAAEKNANEVGTDVIRQSGIINDICQDNSPENLSRKENIEELVNGMNDFCAQRLEEGNTHVLLGDFLSEVSLLTDQDSDKEGDDEKITLMTVHAAKGLEFKNVFVVGMEENLFPSGMAGESPRALEEERRLFYVAITRAEEHCFLSYAKSRLRYGKMEFSSSSRFLKDIDVRFLRLPQDAVAFRKADRETGSPLFGRKESGGMRLKQPIIAPTVPRNLKRVTPAVGVSGPASPAGSAASHQVQQGQLIEHERFGLGEVLKVEGEGDNAKATIRFKNAGDKQLLLRFARFKVID